MDTISTAIASSFITLLITFFIVNFFIKKKEVAYLAMESKSKEVEKQIHINETKFLEQKNNLEINYREEQKLLRNSIYHEGYEYGLAEGKKDHLIEVTKLKSEYREKTLEEINRTTIEVRNQSRAEFELQSKIFSVSIKPYVKIEKNNGLIWDEHKSYTGYQYQLLINGIPAFQPHVVIEHTAEVKEVNEAKLKALTEIAIQATKSAADIYLSGKSSLVKIGLPIVEQV